MYYSKKGLPPPDDMNDTISNVRRGMYKENKGDKQLKKIKLLFEQSEFREEQQAAPAGEDLAASLAKVAEELKDNKSGITKEFVSEMVRTIIEKITVKLEQLDISLDYISAALTGVDAQQVGQRQRQAGRFTGQQKTGTGADKAASQGAPSQGVKK